MDAAELLQESESEQEQEAIQSPFLQGTKIQFAWDSVCLGALKTCPRFYEYTIIEGWTTKGEAIHLRFGIEYHQALHDFELEKANGADFDSALRNTIRLLLIRTHNFRPEPTSNSEQLKTRDNLVRTVIWYLDHFENDPAKTVILDNGKPAIELSFRFELDWGPRQGFRTEHGVYDGEVIEHNLSQPYILCGHLDRVVDFQDDFFVMDRKTTTTTPGAYYFNQFEPNNQITLYSLASQVILSSPVKGVIIDAAQIAVGFSRFTRSFTYRTKDQLEEWMYDLKFVLAQVEEYATSGYWPMNDTACDKFGGCRFRTICSKSPQVREQFLKSNFIKLEEKDRWNPLKKR